MANIREIGLGILATASLHVADLLEKSGTIVTDVQQPRLGTARQLNQLDGYISPEDRQAIREEMLRGLAQQVFDTQHGLGENPLGGIIFRYGAERISRLRKNTLDEYVKKEATNFLVKKNRQTR